MLMASLAKSATYPECLEFADRQSDKVGEVLECLEYADSQSDEVGEVPECLEYADSQSDEVGYSSALNMLKPV